jgi:hypothetical protein
LNHSVLNLYQPLRVTTSRQLRRLMCALPLLCLAAPVPANTEAWVEMNDDKTYSFEVDVNSVKQTTQSEYRVTWRRASQAGKWRSVEAGRVDCSKQSVFTERSVRTDASLFPSEPQKQVAETDFVAGTSTSWWGTKQISNDEKLRAMDFPAAGSPQGRVVRLLCQNHPGFRETHELMGDFVQQQWRCGSSDLAAAPMCKTDLGTRELVGQLLVRLDQVEKACALSSDDTNLVGDVWLKQAMKCSNAKCDLGSMHMGVASLGSDLSRASAGQRCSFVLSAIESAKEEKERNKSIVRFGACVARAVPELDDRVSPANVVAEGVYAACREKLSPALANNTSFSNGVLPSVTRRVLETRQRPAESKGKTPGKPAESKPARARPNSQT